MPSNSFIVPFSSRNIPLFAIQKTFKSIFFIENTILATILCILSHTLRMNTNFRIVWLISLIAVIGIILFQSYWLYNIYLNAKTDFQKETSKALCEAVGRDFSIRSDIAARPNTEHNAAGFDKNCITIKRRGIKYHIRYKKKEDMSKLLNRTLNDLIALEVPIKTKDIDSIYSSVLEEKGIVSTHYITLYNWKTGKILQSTKKDQLFKGSMEKTDFVYPGFIDYHAIRAYVDYPLSDFFAKMKNVLIGSLILIIIMFGTLLYLLRTIFQQHKVSKVREDFMYSMVHELKTPTAFIRNSLQSLTLTASVNLSERQKENIKSMQKRTLSLSNLTEKILTLSSHKQGLLINRKSMVVAEMINDLTGQFRINSDQGRNTKFNLQIADDVDIIDGDSLHLPNAIGNLIDNAIKYSGDVPEVTITAQQHNDHLHISVRDKGIGMSKQAVRHIFDRYYRVQQSGDERIPGFGLGLSYVKQVIDAHGGKIEFKSQPGQGSEFTLILPVSSIKKESVFSEIPDPNSQIAYN